jgi:glyoxylate/hydroxypyruvate reductase A
MDRIDLVCLCEHYDLKALYGAGFAAGYPWIRLLFPDEVDDPGAIRHALAFRPSAGAFDPYPNLRLVSCGGAGVDTLLNHPGLRPGISLSRMINPEQARMMAAFALWYITGWQRRMWDYAGQQTAEVWRTVNLTTPSEFPVGLLGFGNMARPLVAALTGLGYPVTAWASGPRADGGSVRVVSGPEGLAEVAGTSRAMVNLLPLTEATRGILCADFFAEMRDDAMLIQLGRGGHLVEPDLIAALDRGRPAMAALDVTEVEPLPAGHPFWQHPRIMLTPHVASESDAASAARIIAEGILAAERGAAPAGLVDRARGY